MIVTTPAPVPVTIPVDVTEAVPVLLLLQVPPAGVAPNAIDALTHTDDAPEIVGTGLTVNAAIVVQPVASV